jgi:hypothetical protein
MSGVTMSEVEDRKFIRHPSDIPIEYCFTDKPLCLLDSINNVSMGGLSFQADQYIEPNSWLHLHIPINDEHFEIEAQVRWCREREDKHYDVGVLFSSKNEAFSARMVEQVCHIEHYKREVLKTEGRHLSGDEAAAEWIEKYANQFPPSA